MHILFAGGGTAGHINPALAIAGYIKEKHPDAKISYIGTADKLEARLVPAAGYDFYPIKVSGFKRSLSPSAILHNIKAVSEAATASLAARKLLKELKPDVVVGTGGYVSGPVLKEAAALKIKTAVHEQNAFPGVTNKMLASYVDRVMLAMAQAEKHFKVKRKYDVTGNPVRVEVAKMEKEEAKKILGYDNRPVLLSFGGSLGARPINEAVCELIKEFNNNHDFYHIHATGKFGYNSVMESLGSITVKKETEVREYIDNMDVCMAAADLVVCRAGAITLSELALCGKPSILIPSPYVAENHQFHNAMTLKKVGAAEIIEEKDLTGKELINKVLYLIQNKPKLETMSEKAKKAAIPDCLNRIYRIIMELYSNA